MGRYTSLLCFFGIVVWISAAGCTSDAPSNDSPSFTSNGRDTGAQSNSTTDTATSGNDDTATIDSATDDVATSEDTAEPDVAPVDLRPKTRIATFNVRRFFDTRCDSNRCDADDFESVLDADAFASKADRLADAIRMLDADTILLQEVENEACMEALQERLSDIYTTSELGELGFAASLDVGLLSRGSVIEVRRHRGTQIDRPGGGRTQFVREFFEVHLQMPDAGRTIVFTTHFKSQNNDDASRRLAEAIAARDIVLAAAAEFPEALVVLGGDLNDTPGSPPLNAIEELGGLVRVAAELGSQDWTYSSVGGRSAIDHLYLATGAAGEFVSGTAEVFRDGRGAWGGSDHAALVGEFAFPLSE